MWLKMISQHLIKNTLLAVILFGTILVYINPEVENIIASGVIPYGVGFSLERGHAANARIYTAIRITNDNGETLIYIDIGEGVTVEYTFGKDDEE